jgi:hypothetical protein
VTTANLNGWLPNNNSNGLADIATDLVAEPGRVRTAIVLFDTAKITTKVDTRTRTATARIRHFEPITEAEDEISADALLRAALRRRTGTTELPDGLGLDQPVLPFDEHDVEDEDEED